MTKLPESEVSHLEDLIDRHGLDMVLQALEDICYEKAEHLKSNWQDQPAASLWEKDAKTISQANNKLHNIG